MSYMVLDTETTSLDKPFCYDIGYAIFNTNDELVERRHFIVEQIWHNLPLFESAYYKDKRAVYVQMLRARKVVMDKWGYIMRQCARDIRQHGVTDVYAYNSDFDDKVSNFNCDWFKCINPFETLPIHDIWGYASQYITNEDDYKAFCESNEYFTDTGNYKGSAEVVFRYLTNDTDFTEAHMGAYDVDIEAIILQYCFEKGAERNHDYKVVKVLNRPKLVPFVIKVNGKVIHEGLYLKKYIRNENYNFTELGQ